MILAVAALCGASYAHAESLTFEQLVQQALLSSPEAAKIDATLSERAAEAFSVKVKENPVLSGGIELPINPPSEGREDKGTSLTLSQAIRPSDFGARTAFAAVIQEAGDAEKVLALNEYVQNLGILYSRAWQFQETQVLLSDARERAQAVLKRLSDAANQGAFPQGDIELFKAELKILEAKRIAARAELSRTQSELTRLAGFSMAERILRKPNDDIPIQKQGLEQLVRENKLPIQRRYELLRKFSIKQLEVARQDSFPVISPQIGLGHHDDGTNQVMVGFSVPLPFFNTNQADKIRAQGALAAAERAQSYSGSEGIVSEALLLYDAVASAKEQVALYENGVLPASKKAVDAYLRQFEAGSGSAFQLWQSQRELNQSRVTVIELRTTLASTRAQINALIGQQQF